MIQKKVTLVLILSVLAGQALNAVAFSTEGFAGILNKAEAQQKNIELLKSSASTPTHIIAASEKELKDQCNEIGAWGRFLNKLSADNKQRTLTVCGDLIQDKHPRAYAALNAKHETSQETQASLSQAMQKAITGLEKAGANYEAKKDAQTAAELDAACKAVSNARTSYLRNQIIKLTPEQKNMICRWCSENSVSKDTYKDVVNYDNATGEDDAREPYCAAIRTAREDKEKQDALEKAASAFARGFGFGK